MDHCAVLTQCLRLARGEEASALASATQFNYDSQLALAGYSLFSTTTKLCCLGHWSNPQARHSTAVGQGVTQPRGQPGSCVEHDGARSPSCTLALVGLCLAFSPHGLLLLPSWCLAACVGLAVTLNQLSCGAGGGHCVASGGMLGEPTLGASGKGSVGYQWQPQKPWQLVPFLAGIVR